MGSSLDRPRGIRPVTANTFSASAVASPMREILDIEYLAVQIQLASISVQKISKCLSERADLSFDASTIDDYLSKVQEFLVSSSSNRDDYHFIRVAVDGSRSLLTTVISLADNGNLGTLPFRIYGRVLFAVTILLKVRDHHKLVTPHNPPPSLQADAVSSAAVY